MGSRDIEFSSEDLPGGSKMVPVTFLFPESASKVYFKPPETVVPSGVILWLCVRFNTGVIVNESP